MYGRGLALSGADVCPRETYKVNTTKPNIAVTSATCVAASAWLSFASSVNMKIHVSGNMSKAMIALSGYIIVGKGNNDIIAKMALMITGRMLGGLHCHFVASVSFSPRSASRSRMSLRRSRPMMRE